MILLESCGDDCEASDIPKELSIEIIRSSDVMITYCEELSKNVTVFLYNNVGFNISGGPAHHIMITVASKSINLNNENGPKILIIGINRKIIQRELEQQSETKLCNFFLHSPSLQMHTNKNHCTKIDLH